MGFELVISAQRDPLAGHVSDGRDRPCSTHATVTVNGHFDASASEAVLQAVSDLSGDGARSIVVEMQNVEVDDGSALQDFASGLMARRSAGIHVQVATRHEKSHERLARLPDARDWLLAFAKADIEGARVAIHVDGVNTAE